MERRKFFASALSLAPALYFHPVAEKNPYMRRHILIEAHRGNSANAPENTIASFSEAITIGVDRIELDLHCSRDGKLVVMHDDSVDRTTNGTGNVKELDYEYIRQLDAGSWKSVKYKGEKVPLLQEVYELCKGKVMVNIDLKDARAVPALARITLEMGMEDSVVITGLVPACTEDIRNKEAFLTMFYENDEVFDSLKNSGQNIKAIEHAIRQARQYGLPGFLFPFDFVNPDIVYRAHLHGLAVNVWDVNTPEQTEHVVQCGVDALMTDDPAMAVKSLKRFRL